MSLETFFRNSIGYTDLFNQLNDISTFPPHNVEKVDDNKYSLTLALAGYNKSEISIGIDKGYLVIKGAKYSPETRTYIHHGIAYRDFIRKWKLGEYFEVVGASLENGLLTVDIEQNIPEEKLPRIIEIK